MAQNPTFSFIVSFSTKSNLSIRRSDWTQNSVAHLYDEVQRRNILPQHVVGEVVPGDPVVGLGEGGQARVEEDELREVVAVQNPRSGRPLTTTW